MITVLLMLATALVGLPLYLHAHRGTTTGCVACGGTGMGWAVPGVIPGTCGWCGGSGR